MSPASLVELLEARAAAEPDRRAYVFLQDGEIEAGQLTFGELDARARVIADALVEAGAAGGRAVLLYPAGLDFIAAYFGCLYAGAVAVPAPPPEPSRLQRTLPRLAGIVADCEPAAILTTSEGLAARDVILAHAPGLDRARWIATDRVPPGAGAPWQRPAITPHALAHLQYTSGSTSSPKGTMIDHENILENSRAIGACWGYTPESVDVLWVPNYHDDGLVHGLIQPIWSRSTCVIMPPASVVQRPFRWLAAITRWRGTHSGGPNFAFELCNRKIGLEERNALDLSSWRMAYNAAEPIRAETLERFIDRFGPCGFRRTAFYPSFGLAEATLLVSTPSSGEGPLLVRTPEGKTMVGCGKPIPGSAIAIADPDRGTRSAPGQVGEVWVKGPCLARGYWRQADATAETFGARLEGDGPYLRTGDLGFLAEGQLFISGRIKDMVIIRGENHYPQDLEWTVEASHSALRPGACAAFAIEAGGEEQLAIAAEVDPKALRTEVFSAIRQALADAHTLAVHTIALLPPQSIPKTSSGKLQRRATREALLRGTLETTEIWERPAPASDAGEDTVRAPAPPLRATLTAMEPAARRRMIEERIRAHAGKLLGVSAAKLGPRTRLGELGLDSLTGAELRAVLEREIEAPIDVTALYNYPTIEALARHVAERLDLPLQATRADEAPPAAAGLSEEVAETRLFALLKEIPGEQ